MLKPNRRRRVLPIGRRLFQTKSSMRRQPSWNGFASLKKDYEEQMVAAPASDKKRIAAEAFSAFQKAVTDQGLSVNEYISILEVAQNDPEVGDKIRQRLPTSPN